MLTLRRASWLRLPLLILATLLLGPTPLSLAASPVSTGPPVMNSTTMMTRQLGEDEQKPRVVFRFMFMMFPSVMGNFDAGVELRMSDRSRVSDTLGQVSVVNGGRFNRTAEFLTPSDGWVLQVFGTFQWVPDMSEWPLDSQEWAIGFRRLDGKGGVEVDDERTGRSDFPLAGWFLDEGAHAYTRNDGEEFWVSIRGRRPRLKATLKVFLPPVTILLLVMSSFALSPKTDSPARMSMCNSGIISAVTFHAGLDSGYPLTGKLTFADQFMIILYVFLILSLLASVVQVRMRSVGDGNLNVRLQGFLGSLLYTTAPLALSALFVRPPWVLAILFFVLPIVRYVVLLGIRRVIAIYNARAERKAAKTRREEVMAARAKADLSALRSDMSAVIGATLSIPDEEASLERNRAATLALPGLTANNSNNNLGALDSPRPAGGSPSIRNAWTHDDGGLMEEFRGGSGSQDSESLPQQQQQQQDLLPEAARRAIGQPLGSGGFAIEPLRRRNPSTNNNNNNNTSSA